MATIKEYLDSCKNIKAIEDMIVFNRLIDHTLLGKELANDLIKVLYLAECALLDARINLTRNSESFFIVEKALLEIKNITGE